MAQRDRPNVVLIVSDDHGYGDRGLLGIDRRVRTPALDRLAAEGISCDEAYVTAPVCSPSRAGLIAGCYQQRWGARWNDTSRFPPEGRTLAEQFQDLGYATGYFGKVHYGPEQPGERACPPHHGFTESLYGLAGRSMGRLHYLHHTRAHPDREGHDWNRVHGAGPLLDGDREVELEGSLTARLGERAEQFVDTHADRRFFCLLAFNAVHNFCWQLPPAELARHGLPERADWDPEAIDYDDWYDGMISPNLPDGRRYYLAQLELMDAAIGRLLDRLDRRGLAEDTLVIYLTDNGGSTCNFGLNTPLAGTKYTLWEGGIRVPLLARWPAGGIGGGRAVPGLVSALDLYPTTLAAAGAGPQAYAHCDGIDQLALWRGERRHGHDLLYWDCGFEWAVRDETWKLTWVEPDSERAYQIRRIEHAEPGSGLRLHNLAEDPGETVDWLRGYPEVADRLADAYRSWAARCQLDRDLPLGPEP